MTPDAPPAWRKTTAPTSSVRTIIFDSTAGFIHIPSTGTTVGPVRKLFLKKRHRGHVLANQDCTIMADRLVNGAWVNDTDALLNIAVTAGTEPQEFDIEMESPDYRLYVLADAATPTIFEMEVQQIDQLL